MQKAISDFKSVIIILACLWAIYLINFVLPIDIRQFGIQPRSMSGLTGIALAPFLHSNFIHLLSNSSALIPLLFIAIYTDLTAGIESVIVIILVGGLGTWVFGTPGSVHIGASGVIFGLLGYLIFAGIFQQKIKAIIVSLIVLSLYGWLVFTLLIILPGVSWSGHFFGFLGGILAAKLSGAQTKTV